MKKPFLAAAGWITTFALILLALLYWWSIPQATFASNHPIGYELIQEGQIAAIAAVEEEGSEWYVRVRFVSGHPERKCSLSTTTLKKAQKGKPHAAIYRMQYEGDSSWKFIHLVVELPPEAYWQFRWAGWPFFGDHFRKAIQIDL
ncbi:hypothetical protein A2V68_01035 [candidate division Kazan bacterium RBG_13_50_9]|uniref:Uncharacterized protein n=1 Tax=candidate division Kazan bacterium RBG_13_50_9 TaxID=1798535 RepID=A0A1F4NS55_UNCK3|nr:MAG: hypothetical protein A2V68_01035 [candidate division Kazan bacterium RBG_13_50_9]